MRGHCNAFHDPVTIRRVWTIAVAPAPERRCPGAGFLTGARVLIEKEIIGPGQYFYTDETTGLPRKLDVTPELTRYWHEQGGKMLSAGLTVPVPFEHDFSAHPMTPKDRLLNNAGEVKEYRLKGDTLFGVVDVQDPDAKRKIGHSIRWTSPWINSFTDGQGKRWDNVISHLALTTRPRITKQAPFGSIAAALSLATPIDMKAMSAPAGFCLSKAGKLAVRKRDKRLSPRYPIAFSLFSGAALGDDDLPPAKKKPPTEGGDDPAPADDAPPVEEFEGEDATPLPSDGDPTNDATIDLEPFNDPAGDVQMEELLCDLLSALGIHCEKSGSEEHFKRSLYNAAMTKIHELTGKAQADQGQKEYSQFAKPPGAAQPGQSNPLIQQEQQPMYMSLEDINKLDEPLRSVAMSMYNETARANAKAAEAEKVLNSLRDAKLKEASAARATRCTLLGKLSPRVKADLDAMQAAPGMALSMGDGGAVIDPMAGTLAVLEKGLADMPRLLTAEASALSVQPQPTDGEMMSAERADALADGMARMMGCPPEAKRAG